jgi:uncharacterized SAM-binding protein YcdF (DUF218 family)
VPRSVETTIGSALHPLHALWFAPLLAVIGVAQDALGVFGGAPFGDAFVAAHCPRGAIVVMGAAQYDGQPSPAFARRLDGARLLFEAGCAEVVIVSGGRREGDRFSEGAAGVAYLRARGLPAAALVAEEEARTSVENLRNVAQLVPSTALLVVTDDLHAHRSATVARRLGLDAVVAGVEVRTGRLSYALRELGALIGYRLGVFR